MRKYAGTIVGILISLVALYAVARNVSFSEITHSAVGASKSLIIVGIVAVAFGYGIRSFRWWLMLRARSSSISFWTTARILLAGFAANNVLPLRAGDAFRAFGFRNILNISSSFVLATLALERLLDAVSLVVLTVCVIKFSGLIAISAHAVHLAEGFAATGIAIFTGLLVFSSSIKKYSLWLSVKLVRHSERRSAIDEAISNIFDFFESIGALQAIHLAILSIAAWSFEALLYICIAQALSLHASLVWTCMALFAANISSIVPSSPGYVGTFHASIVGVLLLAGLPRNSATAYAVVVHGVLWVAVTFAGAGAYVSLRRKSVHAPEGVIV